jgi:hypothetical protein
MVNISGYFLNNKLYSENNQFFQGKEVLAKIPSKHFYFCMPANNFLTGLVMQNNLQEPTRVFILHKDLTGHPNNSYIIARLATQLLRLYSEENADINEARTLYDDMSKLGKTRDIKEKMYKATSLLFGSCLKNDIIDLAKDLYKQISEYPENSETLITYKSWSTFLLIGYYAKKDDLKKSKELYKKLSYNLNNFQVSLNWLKATQFMLIL